MNKIRPIVSVIVPVYNVEYYLNRCINSIINQKLSNIEVILVDDGSTDESGRICDEYEKMDHRISVIHKENGGLSSARNAGLLVASGKYVGFVDSDDWIDENYYKVLYEFAEKNNADIVTSLFMRISNREYSTCSQNISKVGIKTALDFRLDYVESIIKGGITWAPVWSKLYRRDIINNVRFEEGRIYEDVMFNWRIMNTKDISITYCNYKGYFYYNNSNSITNAVFTDKMYDLFYVIKELKGINIDRNEEVTKLLDIYEKRIYYSILIKMLRSKYNNKGEIMECYNKTIDNWQVLIHSNLSILRKIVLILLVIVPKKIILKL